MKNFVIILLVFIFITNCSLNKVIKHHGVHFLEKKEKKLLVNQANVNDIVQILGPPVTKSAFDNDVYIYIERKTSSTRLTKLGKKELLVNNVLVLEINDKGLLVKKNFYDQKAMNKLKFSENITESNYSKRSFIYNFLTSLRQKIDDPLGKKRTKIPSN
tara:strand:- start:520 stop:996 length:477 start_codon:yes stop_codon:yes gene_type:complete